MKAMEEAMVVFGVDDDTLTLALKLRDRVGPKEINKSQESRSQGVTVKDSGGQGFKDSSEHL